MILKHLLASKQAHGFAGAKTKRKSLILNDYFPGASRSAPDAKCLILKRFLTPKLAIETPRITEITSKKINEINGLRMPLSEVVIPDILAVLKVRFG